MEQKNPFSRSRKQKERKLIDAGIYLGSLVSVRAVQVTDKKTQEKRDKIVFGFLIPEHDVEIAAFFTPSLADTAFIVKFLKTACGAEFTSEIQGDSEKMWQFVQALIGRDFNLVVTQSNGWNNIQSAMIIKPKTPLPVSKDAEAELFAFSDDAIPF